jgi:hypothetical protein
MDFDSDHQYSYKRGSDPELNHPDFFEGNALVGPQLDVTGFLKFDPDHPGGMPASAASSVLYPVGYTQCKHGVNMNYCPKCFEYPIALKSTGYNCEHFKRKNSCRTCYDAAMAYRKELGLPPISWGIFCKHGLNRHDTCEDPECKEGIKSRSGRDVDPLQQPQQAVSRFEQSPFASVFPHESGAQVFAAADPTDNDLSMGGGSKSYRKSARKLKKKTKKSSRKARSYRKSKRSSRRRR